MKSFKAPALHPQRCYILDSVVTLSVRFILTILLGQAEQCWTLFDPTSHPEAFRKTSHGFQQLIPSFSFPGTKMYSSLPIHTNIHALIELLAQAETFCRRCLLSFSKCQTAHRLFRNRFFCPHSASPFFPMINFFSWRLSWMGLWYRSGLGWPCRLCSKLPNIWRFIPVLLYSGTEVCCFQGRHSLLAAKCVPYWSLCNKNGSGENHKRLKWIDIIVSGL